MGATTPPRSTWTARSAAREFGIALSSGRSSRSRTARGSGYRGTRSISSPLPVVTMRPCHRGHPTQAHSSSAWPRLRPRRPPRASCPPATPGSSIVSASCSRTIEQGLNLRALSRHPPTYRSRLLLDVGPTGREDSSLKDSRHGSLYASSPSQGLRRGSTHFHRKSSKAPTVRRNPSGVQGNGLTSWELGGRDVFNERGRHRHRRFTGNVILSVPVPLGKGSIRCREDQEDLQASVGFLLSTGLPELQSRLDYRVRLARARGEGLVIICHSAPARRLSKRHALVRGFPGGPGGKDPISSPSSTRARPRWRKPDER